MRRSVKAFREKKGGKIAMVTAYDYPTALLAERAGVDAILVGDSLGNVVLGYEDTRPVSLAEMVHHTAAARRGAKNTLLIADIPYLEDASVERALMASRRLVKEAGADAVKIEGAKVEVISALVAAGVPVMGHLGLTPQTASQLGGYRVQGKSPEEAERILTEAEALVRAGVFAIVLELVPAALAREVTARVPVPTIGIGAGAETDGQVLVFHDLIGVPGDFHPRFVKRYLEGGELIRAALAAYVEDVKQGRFPGPEHAF